jgi:uncharacterized protein with ATP-grasp and redox domains
VKKLELGREREMDISKRLLRLLSEFEDFDKSPAYYAYFVQRVVKEVAGTEDPFLHQKRMANRKALEILPAIESGLHSSEDKLAYALKVSAAGNYIDFAIRDNLSLEEDLLRLLSSDFAIWDYEILREKLKSSKSVFIVGDNAGEIALDKLLVKVMKDMGLEVYYGVKGKPILNDATYEDAVEVSMTELCKVVDNGSDKVGTWLEDCSKEFLDLFYSSDILISKGQANFETLSHSDRDVFFLLVAKCEPIAEETGGMKGRFVLKFKGVET